MRWYRHVSDIEALTLTFSSSASVCFDCTEKPRLDVRLGTRAAGLGSLRLDCSLDVRLCIVGSSAGRKGDPGRVPNGVCALRKTGAGSFSRIVCSMLKDGENVDASMSDEKQSSSANDSV